MNDVGVLHDIWADWDFVLKHWEFRPQIELVLIGEEIHSRGFGDDSTGFRSWVEASCLRFSALIVVIIFSLWVVVVVASVGTLGWFITGGLVVVAFLFTTATLVAALVVVGFTLVLIALVWLKIWSSFHSKILLYIIIKNLKCRAYNVLK